MVVCIGVGVRRRICATAPLPPDGITVEQVRHADRATVLSRSGSRGRRCSAPCRNTRCDVLAIENASRRGPRVSYP